MVLRWANGQQICHAAKHALMHNANRASKSTASEIRKLFKAFCVWDATE